MVVSDWLIIIGGLLFITATVDAVKTEIEYRRWWRGVKDDTRKD